MVIAIYRYIFTAGFILLLGMTPLHAAECTAVSYESLVLQGRSADEGRQWDKAAEIYSRMLSECSSFIQGAELVKVYDALAVAQVMQENYSAAIESSKKCLELDNRFNSCMMTAAKGYEGLGDRDMAVSMAKSAIEVGGYDDYSAAVVIFAKSYLKNLAGSGKQPQ